MTALYTLIGAGVLGRGASAGDDLDVTSPLVRVRMPACPDSAPGQRVEMTEPGRLFFSANL